MQQLIAGARGAATGTLHSRQQPKRTLGKKLVGRTGGIEEEEKSCDGQETQPYAPGDHQLARAVVCDRNKIKASHDRKNRSEMWVSRCGLILPKEKVQTKPQNQPRLF